MKNNGRYLQLDGWRGLSIITVIIGHFMPLADVNLGRLGVEMFFVLSGRLMAEILFEKHTDLREFFKRRISRVWPAMFFFLIIAYFVISKLFGQLAFSKLIFLSCFTFFYNYLEAGFHLGRSITIDHIWSLCVEEHTYILLALLLVFTKKTKIKPTIILLPIILLMIFNGIAQTVFYHLDYYHVYWRSDVRGASILIGAYIYLLFKQKSSLNKKDNLAILFFLLGFLLSFNAVPDFIKYSMGTIFLAIAINNLDGLSSSFQKILTSKVLNWIGLVSFSIYLWQQPFYALKSNYSTPLLLSCITILGVLSFYFVEVPARRFLNRLNLWG
ncbi:acyltransferase [Methylophilus sp. DW102]|uniref:acyltransferase family protein n=1 Tax=Methylophilus sp. DW102 TaxID=3095607 RepID=UPI0030886AD6|nr:acyltransferase [Methylophilus sp. DW102]